MNAGSHSASSVAKAARKTVRRSILVAALALCGCGISQPNTAREPPAQARTLLEREVPTDGRIRVRSARRIVIGADTPTCYRPGHIIDTAALYGALGQGRSKASGSSRMEPAEPGRCAFREDTVLFWGMTMPDSDANQYKLTLIVWQGDAFWIGTVGRTAANLHERGRNLAHFELPRDQIPFGMRMAESIDADFDDLSTAFIADIASGEQ